MATSTTNQNEHGISQQPPIARAVVCVFCGSRSGTSSAHLAAARGLAHALHAHSISLVYGGGTAGIMGELARTLVALSGPAAVHGIIPRPLLRYEANYDPAAPDDSRVINESLYGKTTVVKDMHARKAMMAQCVQQGGPGSGFVALSGGYGTLEELMEMTTWNLLGIHDKGVVVFNVDGFWDGLLMWMKKAVDEGFVGSENGHILVEAKGAEEVVEKLREYSVATGRYDLKWGEE